MISKHFIFFLLLLLLSDKVLATRPSEAWLSYQSQHFRIHFTAPYQQWAIASAAELENIRNIVEKDQHRVIDEVIDVVIFDPENSANGSAIPLSHKPFIKLYTTPPQSDSMLSHAPSWQQLLILHEYIHVVHLGQKSRHKLTNRISKWWDFYDAIQIPFEDRWVSEGYATLKESKMTGWGRLYNDQVSAIIRQFAREGALPSYGNLSNGNGSYLSNSMAYLVGSHFLSWLEKNYGMDTLDAVWTRWKAVKKRSFDEAFKGVFQQPASKLYKRFVAELTYETLRLDEKNHAETHTGTITATKTETSGETLSNNHNSKLWMDLSFGTRTPGISPDGKFMLVVEADKKNESSLKVYLTEENSKAKEKFDKARKSLLKADPVDIPDLPPRVFKRELKYSLEEQNYSGIYDPRWLLTSNSSDHKKIIYGARIRDSLDDAHRDLFIWDLDSGTTQRLTRNANLRRFDILPDNKTLIAERSRYGQSQLVKLDLTSGSINEITAASSNQIYDFPRISSDGKKLAYLQHANNQLWQLKVRSLERQDKNQTPEVIPMPEGYQFVSFPEWSKQEDQLYFIASVDQQLKLYVYDFKLRQLSSLTDGLHPIYWPTVSSIDNKIWYLQLDSEGKDIYLLDQSLPENNPQAQLIRQTTQSADIDLVHYQLSKAQLPEAMDIPQRLENLSELKNIEPYGIGPQQQTLTVGAIYNEASFSLLEVGIKGGDLLNRLDWQINLSTDEAGALLGYSGNLQWQGWPVVIGLHLFDFDRSPDSQFDPVDLPDLNEQGMQFTLSYPWRYNQFKSTLNLRYFDGQTKGQALQHWTFNIAQTWGNRSASKALYESLNVDWIEGKLGSQDWRGVNGQLNISARYFGIELDLGADWARRFDFDKQLSLLEIGGFESTLIARTAHPNKRLDPALPFYAQSGNDYLGYSASFPLSMFAAPDLRFFYKQHNMKTLQDIDIFGLRMETELDLGFVGLNHIALDLGIARVKQEARDQESKLWAGFWYRWP